MISGDPPSLSGTTITTGGTKGRGKGGGGKKGVKEKRAEDSAEEEEETQSLNLKDIKTYR